MQIREAREHPRDLKKVKAKIEEHISDPSIAETMWYTLPRGKDTIIGPSIRLAEILYNAWGNVRIVSHVVETTATTVTARGVAMDLESNTGVSSDVTVPIYGRGPEAIKQAHMRAQAVARRNATFQIIPGAYQKMALEQARRVFRGEDIAGRIARMENWFEDQGVPAAKMLQYVGRQSVTEITNHDLERLRGMANKIVDEHKSATKAMAADEDAVAHEEALEDTEPDTAEPDLGQLNALQLDANKKFGRDFDVVWQAASDAAGMDYDTLRAILEAPRKIVVASASEANPKEALLKVAEAQKKTR